MSRIREESAFTVPHFPRMEQGDPQIPPDEDLLKDELFPQDMYSGTTYWADLPLGQRIKWVNATSDAEARREFLLLLSELKKDPLQPIRDYFGTYVITGMGMFVEGNPPLYSVGDLTRRVYPLFSRESHGPFPSCVAVLLENV